MRFHHRIVRLLLSMLVITITLSGRAQTTRAEPPAGTNDCRFGITAPYPIDSYDLSRIGVGSFLNWNHATPGSLPGNIEHTKVLRVNDQQYPSVLQTITNTVQTQPGNPGAVYVWIIGNEPDTYGQDDLSDVVYAERYYQLATLIRSLDANDQLGFGPIVQPTPVRLYYLTKVMERLATLAGSQQNALNLIDIYTPHAFLLNENPQQWGSRMPTFAVPGDVQIPLPWDITYDFDRTHDINYFKLYVSNFAKWVDNQQSGARTKPIWITEYGSLLTPIPPPGEEPQSWHVTDAATRDYMYATFDFLFGSEGISTTVGLAEDNNRMVQRAYWYSLNEYRWVFGGSLFDPLSKQLTTVGQGFISYNPVSSLQPPAFVDIHVISDTARLLPAAYVPGSGRTQVNYLAQIGVGNYSMSNLLTNVLVKLQVYNSQSHNWDTVSSAPLTLPRCGGQGVASLWWFNVPPNVTYTLRFALELTSYGGETDPNLGNNYYGFSPTAGVPFEVFLPLIRR